MNRLHQRRKNKAIFGFLEFIQLYVSCGTEVKQCLDPILPGVQHCKGDVVPITNRSYFPEISHLKSFQGDSPLIYKDSRIVNGNMIISDFYWKLQRKNLQNKSIPFIIFLLKTSHKKDADRMSKSYLKQLLYGCRNCINVYNNGV